MPSIPLDPQTLLLAYSQGAFPMTDRDGATRWYTADPRGIIPLDGFHIPKSLRPLLNKSPERGGFEIRFDHDFIQVMRGCMMTRTDGTWISEELVLAYSQLHEMGYAHSVEAWHDGKLVGGLYGVSLGAVFFGESMFHHERDASKVALVHLVQRLRERGYELLDTQASTQHLRRFGCIEIPAEEYLKRLKKAMDRNCAFA
jgi:leucyl/phenylalanyl-tRNA---protein transferase